jgi:hypothetical protein
MPVCPSCNGSEWVARALYDSETCAYRLSEMYDSHTRRALRTNDPHASRTIKMKNLQFSYGWWAARKWVAQVICSIRTTHFQTQQRHYVLYMMATANKFAEPVRAKTHTAGCKTSFKLLLQSPVCLFACGLQANFNKTFFCLFVLSRTSNFSAIWRLSPLPVTGLQI